MITNFRWIGPLLVIENNFEVGHSWGGKLGIYLISKFSIYLVKHLINLKKVAPVGFFTSASNNPILSSVFIIYNQKM